MTTPKTATHCPNGHLYTPGNTGVDHRGYRACLTCRDANRARRNDAIKIIRRDYQSPQPNTWMLDAACAGIDPEMFQPDNWEDAKAAIRVCKECCPVILQCRLEAKAQGAGTVGVWAGRWHKPKEYT